MVRSRLQSAVIAAFGLLSLAAAPGWAQIPTGVTFKPVFHSDGVNKFIWPVAMEEIPGAANSFLVLEKNAGGAADSGRIWRLIPGSGLEHVKLSFLRIPVFSENTSNAELGLLGIAFHPRFRENRKYYVDYNPTTRIHAVDEREFTADFAADAGTAKRLLTLPTNGGHNGGGVAFGPDGFLYVTVGDAVDPTNGQNRNALNGKVLRIDVDKPAAGLPYGIPADNPFQGPDLRGEIYAMGFRNPFRLSFDPLDGALFVGDVGLGTWEEVDKVEKGGNYGWAAFEGTTGGGGPCGTSACLPPNTQYGRTAGRCIIGGHVYRGDPTSKFYGVYIFGDYAYNGPVFGFKADGASGSHVQIGELGKAISGVGRDSRNNIYVIGHDNGVIYQVMHPELRGAPTAVRSWKGGPSRLKVDLRRGRVVLRERVLQVDGRELPAQHIP